MMNLRNQINLKYQVYSPGPDFTSTQKIKNGVFFQVSFVEALMQWWIPGI